MSWFKLKRYSVFCSKFAYSIHHYDLEVTLDPADKAMPSLRTITMKMGKPTNRLCFCCRQSAPFIRSAIWAYPYIK